LPAQATVAADGPVVVLAVERADFLDSLGVHVRSANLARAVADERLSGGAVA
jgi:hypothetical protein